MASTFGVGVIFIILLGFMTFGIITMRFLLATVTVYPRVADIDGT